MSESEASQQFGDGPRVRIAPSPTGDPHVGTAYIALFNSVFARKNGGTFVLRIEDTDQERTDASSERAIFSALRWLGLHWDEGPDCGGPHGPYRQSERLDLYHREIDRLVQSGAAYHCFCTRERLDQVRTEQKREKRKLGYDGHCRDLPGEETSRRVSSGESHVVRLRVPDTGHTAFRDELRGELSFEHEQIDDQVLLKSDGFPTYHLANVVDDHHMGITHVIRGEEWITSTPKHVLLYRAFEWEAPKFFHLGLLRNPDKSKLSKRKNPVSVFHYRDLGYLPETFVNFLGTLGFSLASGEERFSLEEMVEGFDWSRVSTGGPIFDQVKLEAFNAHDIRALAPDQLLARLRESVLSDQRLLALLGQVQERITRLDDFVPYATFFFGGQVDYSGVAEKLRLKQKRSRDEIASILKTFTQEFDTDPATREFTADALEAFARGFCERHNWKPKELFTLLRLAVTGRNAAPPLFDTLALCGKDRVRLRLRSATEYIRQLDAW